MPRNPDKPRSRNHYGPQYSYAPEAEEYLREAAAAGTPYKVMSAELNKRWPGPRYISDNSVEQKLRRMGVKKAKRASNRG